MYAVHFLLFVTTLVLCHIIQSCLKPSAKHGETDEPPEEPPAEEASTKEDEEDCLWAPWSAWSECTVTCGDGISVRHRVTLILGNCTSGKVQEKVCSQQHCPHEKEFIFQRNDEEIDQSSNSDEGIRPEDVEQDHQYQQTQSDARPDSLDADNSPPFPAGHVTGYSNSPHENVNPENDAHFDENNGQNDGDAPRGGRGRGQSWTSDDGNTWGHQSSFDSVSHGEDPDDGFRSGAEEKAEDADNCFSDCSPTEPPVDRFGSEGSRKEEGERDKTDQDEGQDGARNGKDGEGKGEESGDGGRFEGKKKSKNDESVRDDGKVSNDEESRHEVDTDIEDDDNYDDGMEDDDDFDDDDDNDNGSGGGGKKQKREHEEEDAEQEDLEQEEEEEEMEKKQRRKKKRRRKRKRKTKENGMKSNDSQVVCDPTEIADTFLATIECVDSVDVLAVSENEKCDSAVNLTSETELDCSTSRSELDVLEINESKSAKKSTPDPTES